jgi:hypothetical protein
MVDRTPDLEPRFAKPDNPASGFQFLVWPDFGPAFSAVVL